MKVRIKRLDPELKLPEYESPGAVAFDLQARIEVTIDAGQLGLIPTGLVVATPPGYMLVLASRSSGPKKFGLSTPHGIGIIDEDYSGDKDEIMIQVYNFTSEAVTVRRGVRVAQGTFIRVDKAEWDEQETMNSASRGGFGSTGGH